ncbi:MAG: hypothetical protein M1830_004762 [Pleopsidium flavum]|nr:MAG: hypothetical protein M1830_004762 [Pleopsidium flavum]
MNLVSSRCIGKGSDCRVIPVELLDLADSVVSAAKKGYANATKEKASDFIGRVNHYCKERNVKRADFHKSTGYDGGVESRASRLPFPYSFTQLIFYAIRIEDSISSNWCTGVVMQQAQRLRGSLALSNHHHYKINDLILLVDEKEGYRIPYAGMRRHGHKTSYVDFASPFKQLNHHLAMTTLIVEQPWYVYVPGDKD